MYPNAKRPLRSALALAMAAVMAMSTCSTAFAARSPKASGDYVPTGEHTEWYNGIETPGINREPYHTQFIPYDDRDLALQNETSALDVDETTSPYYELLSGKDWDFTLVKTPEEAAEKDAAYLAETLDEEAQKDFEPEYVPQAWQTYRNEDGSFKYFDEPMYTNSIYPWGSIVENGKWQQIDYRNPHAPTMYNPVGYYRTTFQTPSDWDGREIFVSFQSVCSAYYLYVNGQYVGYTTDSYTAHDFNITPYLNGKDEENTIALKVFRWSIGSYLENQDYINESGIFRDVYLYSKDDVEIRDFFVRTEFDDRTDRNSDVTLELDVDVRGLHNAEAGDYSVEATLLDMSDEEVGGMELGPVHIEATEASTEQTQTEFLEKVESTGKTVTSSMIVTNPDKWFPDTPNLYKLLIELKDVDGNVIETAVQRIGFREVYKVNINEAEQEQMQITGEKAVFRGTNRHDSNLETGRAVTREDIIQDLTLMKKYNVNSVRTSHYPNDKLLYELADELGLYVCCEANIESHYGGYSNEYEDNSQVIPSGNKKWVPTVLDRTENMLERYKNHASIVMWSLGNEATYTKHNFDDNYCFWVSSQRVLERDPSRLRMYERESDNYYHRYQKDKGADPMDMEQRRKNIVDVHSTQYPTPSAVESYAKNPDYKMPYMEQEYAHAMGQALGNFKEFWDLVRKYPNLQGGFIWDWVDQSIATKVPENTVSYVVKDTKTATEAILSDSAEWTQGRDDTKAIEGGYLTVARGDNLRAKGDALTMEVWIKPTGIPSKDEGFISTGDNGLGLKVNARGSTQYFELFVDGWAAGTASADLPEDFADGNWHQLIGMCAADKTLHIYWDGKELANTGAKSTTASAPFDSASEALTVGLDSASSDRVFSGAIDSVRIYQRALTTEEMQSADRTKEDEGVVYWLDFSDEEVETRETNYDWLDDKLDGYYWGYGGDWIDRYSNADAFCANGILYADRTPNGKTIEVGKVHQQVNFYDDGKAMQGEVRVVNEFENTNLDQFDIVWKVTEDTETIGTEQTLELDLAPLSEDTVQLELPEFTPKAGSDYLLECSVRYKEDTAWANAGDELAFEQIPLTFDAGEQEKMDISAMQAFSNVAETETEIRMEGVTAEGQAYSITLNKETGVITNYSLDGETILEKGPVPSYWRAQTYNDITNYFPTGLRNAEDTMKNVEVTVEKKEDGKLVSVAVSEDLQVDASNYVTYDIYSNGEIVVSNQLVPHSNFAPGGNGQNALPKVGMRMQVAQGYEELEYYGRGPMETYCDRETGSKLGVYNSTVDEQFEYKMMKPQENGNHTDVRWTSLTNETGTGLMVTADGTMETSAQHYTAEELNPALSSQPYNSGSAYRHPYQVPMREDTIWCIDYMQRGVSNTAFFGHVPLDPYRLDTDKTYTHAFRISPVAGDTDKMASSKVAVQPSSINYPITDIKVDGVSIKGFDPSKTEYEVEIAASSKLPQVTATSSLSSVQVEVSFQGNTALVNAVLSGETKTYTIHFSEVDVTYVSDLDVNDWTLTGGGNVTMDHTAFDGPLSLNVNGTVTYDKGVSVQHPEATYESRRIMSQEIPIEGKGYERFKVVAGVDTVTPNWAAMQIDLKTTDGQTISILPRTGWMTGTYAAMEIDKALPTNAKSLVFTAEMDNSSVVVDFADAKLIKSVASGRAALEELIAKAEQLDSTSYTEETWAAVAEALKTAKELPENALQAQIQAVADALQNAMANLESKPGVNHTLTITYGKNVSLAVNGVTDKLADIVGRYQLKDVAGGSSYMLTFTPKQDSQSFRSVQVNGGDVQLISGRTYTVTDTMPNADTTLNYVFELTNKTTLGLVIDFAQKHIDAGEVDALIPVVKENFLKAFNTAKTVYSDPAATQLEINAAWSDLLDMIQMLEFKPGNKDDLRDLIAEVEGLQENDYTADSWKTFSAALEEARKTVADENAMQDSIEESYEKLYNAAVNLIIRANFDELQLLIEKAEKLDLKEYLEDGQEAFTTALKNAKALTKDAAQDEINRAATALAKAMAALRLKPSREKLQALLDEIANMNLNQYTEASAEALKAAADRAQNALNNPDTPDEEIGSLIGEVTTLRDNLVRKSPNGGSSSGSSKNHSNTAGSDGYAVAVGAGVVAAQAKVISDTTVDFTVKRGSAYCFKMTVVNGNNATPSFTVGNGSVLKTQFVAKVGNDYYYRVWAIGAPGSSTGVYTTLPGQQSQKHCTVRIG